MPGPAARVGDPTAHGGTIMPPGCPTVLIGGMPAARVTDMQVCPMVTPAPAPVPHVGIMISGPGVPTVLIGGMPAATIGDMTTCTGPPGTIIMGCPTVLIGTGGGGSGGAGGGAVMAARDGAHSALVGQQLEGEGPHWKEIQFVDKADNPITQVPYELTGVDGQKENYFLTKDGKIRRGNLPKAGQFTVQLFSLFNAKWSKDEAKVGDVVKLTAEVEGYKDGTEALFVIWERDLDGKDDHITQMTYKVQGGKVEAEWKYEYHEDDETSTGASNTGQKDSDNSLAATGVVVEDSGSDEHTDEDAYPEAPENKLTHDDTMELSPDIKNDRKTKFSSPEYYFVVKIGDCKARSGLLEYKGSIEINLKDNDGKPVGNAKYKVYFDNGEIKEGTLDSNGYKKIEDAPPVAWSVQFPEYQKVDDYHEG